MYAKGHYGAALLAYAPVGYALLAVSPTAAFVGGAGVIALATLPDVDHRLPLVRHRGPTHSLLFLVAVSAALAALGWQLGQGSYRPLGGPAEAATLGAVVGVVAIGSHLLADLLTPMGVNLLWPYPGPMLTLDVTRADNPLANWLLLAVGVGVTAAVLYLPAPG